MDGLFTIKFKWSDSHLVMPRIVGGLLVILAVLLLIQRAVRCKKTGAPFISFGQVRFFERGYDNLKFWGFLVLMPCYILALNKIGFLYASLIFIFLFNVLFAESVNFKALAAGEFGAVIRGREKSLFISMLISAAASTGVWYLFGVVFNITLP